MLFSVLKTETSDIHDIRLLCNSVAVRQSGNLEQWAMGSLLLFQ